MAEDAAVALLREILARPEYQFDQSRPWWQQLLAPLFDLIGYLVARLIQTAVDTTAGREGWFGLAIEAFCVVLFVMASLT